MENFEREKLMSFWLLDKPRNSRVKGIVEKIKTYLFHNLHFNVLVVTSNYSSDQQQQQQQHSELLYNTVNKLFERYSERLRIVNLSDRRFCGPLTHVKHSQQVIVMKQGNLFFSCFPSETFTKDLCYGISSYW